MKMTSAIVNGLKRFIGKGMPWIVDERDRGLAKGPYLTNFEKETLLRFMIENHCGILIGAPGFDYGNTLAKLPPNYSLADEIRKLQQWRYERLHILYPTTSIGYMGNHHLLVYITKDGEENDKSWQTLKNIIEMPIVLVAEEDAEDCIDEILTAKSMYYRIRGERTKRIYI